MITANEARTLMKNMRQSKDSATKELGEAVSNIFGFNPHGDGFTEYALRDVERAINILQGLKLRLEGWTHPGCNGLEW